MIPIRFMSVHWMRRWATYSNLVFWQIILPRQHLEPTQRRRRLPSRMFSTLDHFMQFRHDCHLCKSTLESRPRKNKERDSTHAAASFQSFYCRGRDGHACASRKRQSRVLELQSALRRAACVHVSNGRPINSRYGWSYHQDVANIAGGRDAKASSYGLLWLPVLA